MSANLKWWWLFFVKLFQTPMTGSITLGNGEYQMLIATHLPPAQVFLSINSSDIQTCEGNLDYVSTSLEDEGFILYAKNQK